MTRYFFHTEDGRCFPDEHGVELARFEDVRRLALKTLAEMSSTLADELWREGFLRVTAADESGLPLLTLELSAKSSEAAPTSRAIPGRALNPPRGEP